MLHEICQLRWHTEGGLPMVLQPPCQQMRFSGLVALQRLVCAPQLPPQELGKCLPFSSFSLILSSPHLQVFPFYEEPWQQVHAPDQLQYQ